MLRRTANGLLAVLALLTAFSFATCQSWSQEPEPLLYRFEHVWRKVYVSASDHKAIAISPNGAIGVSSGRGSTALAEEAAMATCREWSKFIALRNPPAPACEVLASDADWKIARLKLDDDWQKPSAGRDIPMRKGRRYTVAKSRGIILHVHGCNGMGDKIFSDVWGAYFNALGFDLYVPNSFAVRRPKETCGSIYDFPARQVSDIWRLRVAQTLRTLADLKAANPGKLIYVWGHSEGGLIVQMVRAEVAGVIVSGEECGVIGAPPAVPFSVPILYLWGEYDIYVNTLGGFKITDQGGTICSQRYPQWKMRAAVIPGRTHNPWPWNNHTSSAIADFLHVAKPPEVLADQASRKTLALWKKTRKPKSYMTGTVHRAAASTSKGTSQMVWGLDSEEDARQLALFGCNRLVARGVNVFKTGRHRCVVVDVDGKPPS